MKQIRIYYECLEQAENYIKPIIEKIIDKKISEIVLVKRPKTTKDLNSGSISAIQTLTTPDALITGIVNGKEYPLIPNGFQIVSVSYPGSQGGGAVLPSPELGKSQPREYPDVIALPPTYSNIDVVLNESKGMFSKSGVEKDLEKILRYKTDTKLKTALKETLFVAQVIDKNKQLKNIVVGVAFGVKNGTITDWQPDNVDFIFRITNRNEWAIGIFKQEMKDLIKEIEGKTNFPATYKLSKEINSAPKSF